MSFRSDRYSAEGGIERDNVKQRNHNVKHDSRE